MYGLLLTIVCGEIQEAFRTNSKNIWVHQTKKIKRSTPHTKNALKIERGEEGEGPVSPGLGSKAMSAEYKKRLKALMRLPENQVCSDCPGTQLCPVVWASLVHIADNCPLLATRTATEMGLPDQTSSGSTARDGTDGLILLSRMFRKPSTIGCAHWFRPEYQFRFV